MLSSVRGRWTRARRIYRQRGARQFLRDALLELFETQVGLQLKPALERRALRAEDLDALCRHEGTYFDYYDGEETYYLNLPTTPYGYTIKERERMRRTYCSGITIDSPYVCELPGVELIGPDALPMLDGQFVFENSIESGRRIATSCLRAACEGTVPVDSNLLSVGRHFDTIVSLVGPWTGNYTHWFQDYLARLEGFEHYQAETEREAKLLVPAEMSDWMRDALKATGYGPEQWIEWTGGRARVDRFVVPAVRREKKWRAAERRLLYSPKGFLWLRDRITENVVPERTRSHSSRIFISRANATVRRVQNEAATMELLSRWGFECYRPDELSFAEQVTLFSNAEAIISSHGSGLLNQIYADNATVIEIFGPKHSTTDPAIEYYLADLLGHNYGCMQGTSVGPDVKVDLDGLERLLEKLLG